jgi:hypothetical protein
MAKIKRTDIWNGLKVDVVTDTKSGVVEVLQYNSTNVLAFADGPNWSIVNDGLFTNLYNANKEVKLSTSEVSQTFFNGGTRQFNKVRADILNDNANYSSLIDANQSQITFQGFVKIPGVINPVSGKVNDEFGNASTAPIFGTQSSPNTSGVTDVSLYEGANQYIDPTINFDPSGLTGFDPGLRFLGDPILATGTSNNTTNTSQSEVKIYRFPEAELTEYGYDYIKISAYTYQPRLDGKLTEAFLSNLPLTSGGPIDRKKDPQGTVYLPMQSGVSESNSVGWGEDSLNAFTGALASGAYGAIGNLGEGLASGNLLRGFSGAVGSLGSSVQGLLERIKDNPAVENQIKAYFAGQAVGANIVARATGQVINPNLELLFTGPKLRSFAFNFPLIPRTEKEANIVRDMIKFFKINMAVRQSSSDLFLYTPNIFQLEYIYGDNNEGQHPYLNLFKPCALTNFSVTYNPANDYMTYEGGSMTQYNLSMTFNELEPIYKKDQEDEEAKANMGY